MFVLHRSPSPGNYERVWAKFSGCLAQAQAWDSGAWFAFSTNSLSVAFKAFPAFVIQFLSFHSINCFLCRFDFDCGTTSIKWFNSFQFGNYNSRRSRYQQFYNNNEFFRRNSIYNSRLSTTTTTTTTTTPRPSLTGQYADQCGLRYSGYRADQRARGGRIIWTDEESAGATSAPAGNQLIIAITRVIQNTPRCTPSHTDFLFRHLPLAGKPLPETRVRRGVLHVRCHHPHAQRPRLRRSLLQREVGGQRLVRPRRRQLHPEGGSKWTDISG